MSDKVSAEDKQYWCEYGLEREYDFVDLLNDMGIDAEMNPRKLADKFAPDLLVQGTVSDLKTQNEYMWSSGRYSTSDGKPYDPPMTFTLNKKDVVRYSKNYPDIRLFFWARWLKPPVERVYFADFPEVQRLIRERGYALHRYQNRGFDQHNAVSSYIIDLNDLHRGSELLE